MLALLKIRLIKKMAFWQIDFSNNWHFDESTRFRKLDLSVCLSINVFLIKQTCSFWQIFFFSFFWQILGDVSPNYQPCGKVTKCCWELTFNCQLFELKRSSYFYSKLWKLTLWTNFYTPLKIPNNKYVFVSRTGSWLISFSCMFKVRHSSATVLLLDLVRKLNFQSAKVLSSLIVEPNWQIEMKVSVYLFGNDLIIPN